VKTPEQGSSHETFPPAYQLVAAWRKTQHVAAQRPDGEQRTRRLRGVRTLEPTEPQPPGGG
jgi:hypothetical protein